MLDFDHALQQTLARHAFHPGILAALDYAVRPPGKLFRPLFLAALAQDLGAKDARDVVTLGCALEIHHAYSLVHDDMPCMDNDLVRRGKPATHVAYGEWKALLTGDSLMLISYAELEHLKSPASSFIRRFFHWATGPKGLILGQWIDLGHEGAQVAARLMRMHELKTARLMQVATTGALALANPKFSYSDVKKYLRLGASVGLAFQLLDDLDDLSTTELSAHERAVNPFMLAAAEATTRLQQVLHTIEEQKQLPATKTFLTQFLKASAQKLVTNQNVWGQHVPTQQKNLVKLFTSGICA